MSDNENDNKPRRTLQDIKEDEKRAYVNRIATRMRAKKEGVNVRNILDFLRYRQKIGEVGGPDEGEKDYPGFKRKRKQ